MIVKLVAEGYHRVSTDQYDYGIQLGGVPFSIANSHFDAETMTVVSQNRQTAPSLFLSKCIYRGSIVRTTTCSGCRDSRETDVHECRLHGECVGRSVQDKTIRRCHACHDDVAPPALDPTNHIFVWPYVEGPNDYDELRWSLRSVAAHCDWEPRLMLLGQRPGWWGGEWMKKRRNRHSAHGDVIEKLLMLAAWNDCPEWITWMMDDVYLMQPFGVDFLSRAFWVARHTQDVLNKWHPPIKWPRMKKRTSQLLLNEGRHVVYCYATHMPYTLNRDRLREMIDRYDVKPGLIWETVYGNNNWQNGEQDTTELHRVCSERPREWWESGRAKMVWNNGPGAWTEDFRRLLFGTFPVKAPGETKDAKPCKPAR